MIKYLRDYQKAKALNYLKVSYMIYLYYILSDNVITKAGTIKRIRDPCSPAVNVDYYSLDVDFRETQKWLNNLPGEYIGNDET